jgi:ribonuclease E
LIIGISGCAFYPTLFGSGNLVEGQADFKDFQKVAVDNVAADLSGASRAWVSMDGLPATPGSHDQWKTTQVRLSQLKMLLEAPLLEAPLLEAPLLEAPLLEAPLLEAPLQVAGGRWIVRSRR